ncbi:threonine--tRNA ligase [Pseudaquidulcibacter saccharophilus]|uniref:threonine--tRNA ligase n=1 Tax=Pseudaquidulcibacter saccharophilus TaxID=2831900 RepID=UPI001EFF2321|nr:threonine--tRNA ligase [Pseudaquidulcibacter saccharophilus]
MFELKFPDGAIRQYENNISPLEIAEGISKSLAKRVVGAKIDGQVWDLSRPIEPKDTPQTFELINRDSDDGLEIIRHDAAHIMAQAVQELFPDTQITIGPSIEDGYYYDFVREDKFSTDDFEKIEAKMREIVDRDLPIVREEWDREVAIKHFNEIGEIYKAKIIEEIIPEGETLTVYKQGDNWKDLCRGPHMPSTGRLGKAFKLMKLAGAYWRGDAKNAQLQRIYGTAWADEKGLKDYLVRLEEAEKRDHRKLGRQLNLFHMQEEAKGMVFWHPKGWTMYRALENYIRRKIEASDYVEVKTPQLMDKTLWEKSGHWEKFGHAMFTCETVEEEILAVKPMNCPGHVQIFNQGQKSYRDLPLRMAEMGCCHRFEPSGGLHGIMRVRNFTQDDGHIFCRVDQIYSETKDFCELLRTVYNDLGVELHSVKLALRPDVRAGSDETWDYAEKMLKEAAEAAGEIVELLPNEGAFYGPKLEFHLKDAIGRTWQCGTLQLDFVLPERLDAEYTGEDGQKHRPVMLHRAILGTFERFLGILIENHAGNFPMWLAPVQVVVANITSDSEQYAKDVCHKLRAAGIRAETDVRNEKINFKIREHSLQKVPVIAVVGSREAAEGKVALRRFGSQAQEILSLEEAMAMLSTESLPPDMK